MSKLSLFYSRTAEKGFSRKPAKDSQAEEHSRGVENPGGKSGSGLC
jgi:hypothetical protein